jgi:Flp pilus assembly protein TadD
MSTVTLTVPEALRQATEANDNGRLAEAEHLCRTALGVAPRQVDAIYLLAVVQFRRGQFAEALSSFDRVLALRSDHADAHNWRGVALVNLQRFDEALASFDNAIAARPGYVEALNNRGNTLAELQRHGDALASYEQVLAVRPDDIHALTHCGNVLMDLCRSDEATARYERAIAAAPGTANAHLGRSLCLLLAGDFERGWPEYEWRWAMKGAVARGFSQPLWLGDADIAGSTILLHAEQGFGDTLQFCRYAKRVAARGANVVLEVQPELRSLMASLDPAIPVIVRGDALPPFDRHAPLMSLPLAFKTTPATVPAETRYLAAPPDQVKFWRARLGDSPWPRVGLAWSGKPRKGLPNANRIDRQRSITFDQLAPALAADCTFVSLQKGDEAAAQLREGALRHRVIDWTEDFCDFADTAALIENLDLVITVDTAVVHLAAALGKPVWLMNRRNSCWRWQYDRDDSPWYPTARIFRQTHHGDWRPVIERIGRELRGLNARSR